jgi:hypothetical protein
VGIPALFTIAKLWHVPRYLKTDKQIKKIWYTYTMEYYSVTKKNKIMSGKWGKLEIIIKAKITCFCSYGKFRSKAIIVAIIMGHGYKRDTVGGRGKDKRTGG